MADGARRGEVDMRFSAYQNRLFGYALALARNEDDAAELVQECVLRAMQALRTPADEPAYRAWLFTIVRNLWHDRQRKHCVREEVQAGPEAELSLEQLGQEEITLNVIAVRQAFERLSPEHRDILALVDVGGFGYKESSEILGIPEGTVMSRVSRARANMCRLLSDVSVQALAGAARKAAR